MTTLPYDIQRCSGLIHGPGNLRCKQRRTCKRYLAWEAWVIDPAPEYVISAGPAVPNCKQKIEVEHAD